MARCYGRRWRAGQVIYMHQELRMIKKEKEKYYGPNNSRAESVSLTGRELSRRTPFTSGLRLLRSAPTASCGAVRQIISEVIARRLEINVATSP